MSPRRFLPVTLAVAALAGACAVPGTRDFAMGSSAESVVQALGRPTGEHPSAAGGRRLEYSGGAYGRTTAMFDFDASNRLVGTEQVRTEAHFGTIRAGMTADEVRARIGLPSTIWRIPRQQQDVWSYRFETPFCRWFMVGIGPDSRVVDTSYGPDPMCDRDNVRGGMGGGVGGGIGIGF